MPYANRLARLFVWTCSIILCITAGLALMLLLSFVCTYMEPKHTFSTAVMQEWEQWAECDSTATFWADSARLEKPIGNCADIDGIPGRFQENEHPYRRLRAIYPPSPDWRSIK